ncbi:MAG: 2Fe-2S iron-sulfur cluster binding domain-containing protein [Emcibacter sp.]|nr:2Fe-2S iron-sulfur cluster binding domain-containing protein [Emcibacter sp.]
MAKLHVLTSDGTETILNGDVDTSVLEIMQDAGNSDLMALCGGCCSCATCHVYVDEQWLSAVGAVSEDEGDLLDSSDHKKNNSRLACQVKMTDALDGLRVMIAPED